MSIFEIITPYVPELIGVLCFIIGYFLLDTFKPAEDPLTPDLIEKQSPETQLEKSLTFCKTSENVSISHFNEILKTCQESKNLEKTFEVFQCIKSSHLSPDIQTFEILAISLFEHKKYLEILEIITPGFPGFSINETLQSVFIDCYCRTFQVEKAVQIFEASLVKEKIYLKLASNLIKANQQERLFWMIETYKPGTAGFEGILETACKFESCGLIIQLLKDNRAISKSVYMNSVKCLVKNSFLEPAFELINRWKGMADDSIICFFLEHCGKQGKFELSMQVVQDFLQDKIEISLYSVNLLLDLSVKSQNHAELWQVALKLAKSELVPDSFSYSCIVKSIKMEGEHTDLEKAFEFLSYLKNRKVAQYDEIFYNCLLDACVMSKKIEKALVLFEEMEKLDEISYNTIIKGFSMTKQVDRAIETLKKMKDNGIGPTAVTYNSIIDTCVRCSQVAMAWEYLEEMQQRGLHPDNFTYSTLVKGIKGENSIHELNRIFSILEKGKTSPDEVLYNCLIDACSRMGDTVRCVEIFQQMQNSKIEASSVTYGIMIKAYGQANMLPKALGIFNEMNSKGLKANDVTYGCLLDACVKSGDIEMAEKLFFSMQSEGVVLNTILYTTMIKGFTKSQNLPKALNMLKQMKVSVQPNNVTYNSLLDCAVRCEDMQTAHHLFDEMRSLMIPDLISYSTMIKGLCKAGEVEAALEILTTMRKSDIQPDEVLFNSLLDGCAKLGNLEIAEKVYIDMKSLNIKPSNVTYSILIKLYGKNKQISRALEVLDDMKLNKVQPGLIVYTCLLQACIRCKQIHKAIQIYHDMNRTGLKGDRVTFNTLVNGCVYAKQLETAFQVAVDSFGLGVKLAEDVYNNLVKNLINSKISSKVSMANEVVEHMKKIGVVIDPALVSILANAKSTRVNCENSGFAAGKKVYSKKVAMGERSFNIH